MWRSVLSLLCIIPCLHGFAAKKKGGSNKRRVARTSKGGGFGAPPPSFDDIVGEFGTRLPPENDVDCPCGSGKPYESCCMPFHNGEKSCLLPEDVLRTRYSAFSYRLVKYVIETTHSSCRDYQDDKIAWAKEMNKDGMFDSYDFIKLDIEDQEAGQGDDEAFIDFKVRLRAKGSGSREGASTSLLAGKETIISEKSRFLRGEVGVWTYASGEVRSEVSGLQDTVLNR